MTDPAITSVTIRVGWNGELGELLPVTATVPEPEKCKASPSASTSPLHLDVADHLDVTHHLDVTLHLDVAGDLHVTLDLDVTVDLHVTLHSPSTSPSTPPKPDDPTPILKMDCSTLTIGLDNPADGVCSRCTS